MPKVRFEGFKTGAEVAISVSAGGGTKGPLNISAWKQPAMDGSATLTINMTRATTRVAPELVHMEAVVTGDTGLKTPVDGFVPDANGDYTVENAAALYDQYDQQAHELEFVWSFGLTGTFDKVSRLPEAMRQKNVGLGKRTVVVYEEPGNYEITCSAYRIDFNSVTGEQTSVLVASATEQVTIVDDTAFYTGANVYCISENFSGNDVSANAEDPDAPVGSRGYQTYSALVTSKPSGILPADSKVLFKRGETHTWTPPTTEFRARPTWAAYGTGARPILNLTRGWSHNTDNVDFIKLVGLDIRGAWDPVNEAGESIRIRFGSTAHTLFCDCVVSNLGHINGGNRSASDGFNDTVTLWDTSIDGWQDYGFIPVNGSMTVSAYMRGSAVRQDPLSSCNVIQGGKNFNSNDHGPTRLGHPRFIVIDQCDLFSHNTWISFHQPCARLITGFGATVGGAYAQVTRNIMEGGGQILASGTVDAPVLANNMVIEKNILIYTYSSGSAIGIGKAPATVRNNVVICPDIQRALWNSNNQVNEVSGRSTNAIGGGFGSTSDNSVTVRYPLRMTNNTLIDYKTYTADDEADEMAVVDLSLEETFTGLVEIRDNVRHAPNRSVSETPLGASPELAAALTTYAVRARHDVSPLGDKTLYQNDTLASNGLTLIAPGNVANLLRPVAGASVIGAATGPAGRLDLFGNVRPADAASGAVEAR
jgi:hypothetical protein